MRIHLISGLLLLLSFTTYSAEDMTEAIRRNHPRIYVNAETLPLLRARAKGVAKPYYENIRKAVDALPDNPVLELDKKRYKINSDGSAEFIAPAREGQHLVKYCGGREALRAALVYLVDGEEKYRDKAYRYLRVALEFYQWCHQHRLQVEWHNFDRLDAIVAYDWLTAYLNNQQRRDFIVPMLEFVDQLQDRGKYKYFRNGGDGHDRGFYGDRSLLWFAGIAAYGDGYSDTLE